MAGWSYSPPTTGFAWTRHTQGSIPFMPSDRTLASSARLVFHIIRVFVSLNRWRGLADKTSNFLLGFFRTVCALGKDAVVVLKHDEWTLNQEARALCDEIPPEWHTAGKTQPVLGRGRPPVGELRTNGAGRS